MYIHAKAGLVYVLPLSHQSDNDSGDSTAKHLSAALLRALASVLGPQRPRPSISSSAVADDAAVDVPPDCPKYLGWRPLREAVPFERAVLEVRLHGCGSGTCVSASFDSQWHSGNPCVRVASVVGGSRTASMARATTWVSALPSCAPLHCRATRSAPAVSEWKRDAMRSNLLRNYARAAGRG